MTTMLDLKKFIFDLKKDLRKHFTAPSSHCGEQSWSQIPGGVDGVTAIKTKGGANDEHD